MQAPFLVSHDKIPACCVAAEQFVGSTTVSSVSMKSLPLIWLDEVVINTHPRDMVGQMWEAQQFLGNKARITEKNQVACS